MVSQIGQPVTEPVVLQAEITTRDGRPAAELETQVDEIAADHMSRVPDLINEFVDGTIDLF